jgi:hypothetical protein
MLRQGGRFSDYFSMDSVTWYKVGEVQAVGANETLDAGLFAHWSSARFSEVKVTGQPCPPAQDGGILVVTRRQIHTNDAA